MTVEGNLYADKLLPHDIEAEEGVLGSLLIDPDAIHLLIPLLRPEDFYRERNGALFGAALKLAERGVAIDQVTLASELSNLDLLESMGGVAYLSHLVAVTQPRSMLRTMPASSRTRRLSGGSLAPRRGSPPWATMEPWWRRTRWTRQRVSWLRSAAANAERAGSSPFVIPCRNTCPTRHSLLS